MPDKNNETNAQKSSRERYIERLKGRYPDKEFADDESMYAQANEDYDAYDKQIQDYEGKMNTLTDLFASNPNSATLFTLWGEGKDPIVESARMYGPLFKEALDDPSKLDEIAAANKEFAEKVAEEEKYETEYAENIKISKTNFNDVFSKLGCSGEEQGQVYAALNQMMKDGILGLFSTATIENAVKAIRHDTDVEEANMEGVARGRNEKIVEKERRRSKGDGIANISGKNGGGKASSMPPKDYGAMNNFGNSSIFERGGEKRRKRN